MPSCCLEAASSQQHAQSKSLVALLLTHAVAVGRPPQEALFSCSLQGLDPCIMS